MAAASAVLLLLLLPVRRLPLFLEPTASLVAAARVMGRLLRADDRDRDRDRRRWPTRTG